MNDEPNPHSKLPPEPPPELRTCFKARHRDGQVELVVYVLLLGGGTGEFSLRLRVDEALELMAMLSRELFRALPGVTGLMDLLKKPMEGGSHAPHP